MSKEELVKTFADLKEKTLEVFRAMLAAAPNPKTGAHTLDASSNIWQSTKVEIEDLHMINVILPYYIQYVDGINNETGEKSVWARRPKAMRGGYQGGQPGFVEAIEQWMRKRGIPTNNGGLWRMVNGIEKNGILARPVFDNWEQEVDKILDKWLTELFNAILSDLDEYFNK